VTYKQPKSSKFHQKTCIRSRKLFYRSRRSFY